jgi:hypothetical protein
MSFQHERAYRGGTGDHEMDANYVNIAIPHHSGLWVRFITRPTELSFRLDAESVGGIELRTHVASNHIENLLSIPSSALKTNVSLSV